MGHPKDVPPLRRSFVPLILALASASLAAATGDGTFQSPLKLPFGASVGIAAGDFNRDGKLDLAAVNGSSRLTILLQDPRSRSTWNTSAVTAGVGTYFIATADFDGDRADDLVLADPSSTAYFLRSKTDGTFERPLAFKEARSARAVAIGDWDRDGRLDLATANHDLGTVTVYRGGGDGSFKLSLTLHPTGEPHDIEAGDFDGDGMMDLLVGLPSGIQPLHSRGDGRFDARPVVTVVGGGRYFSVADFNNDGKADLVGHEGVLLVALSSGDGKFRRTFNIVTTGFAVVATGDLNADAFQDLVSVAQGEAGSLQVHRGKGDGAFLPAVSFAGVSNDPTILTFPLVRDLDRDGNPDVVSSDGSGSGLAVTWGLGGDRMLNGGFFITGFTSAKALEVADLDLDGKPDLFLPSGTASSVAVYLASGLSQPRPSLTIDTVNTYTSLAVADLDGDGVPDLAGANRVAGTACVALLDSKGAVRSERDFPAGLYPSAAAVGRLDEGETADLAVVSTGSSELSIFLGLGGGAFRDRLTVATAERAKDLTLGNLDADGRTDIAVISAAMLVVHRGLGGGAFSDALVLLDDTSRYFTDLAIADADGDALADLFVTETRNSSVLLFRGKGDGSFEAPATMKVGRSPLSLTLADLNGDGLPDITTGGSTAQSISVLLNRGGGDFDAAVDYSIGFPPQGHRVADLDGDGVLDLAAWKGNTVLVLAGRPAQPPARRFRRGDASGDGALGVEDPIAVLNRLFLGGEPLACEDAADANDDGELNLTDAVASLARLFLGADPLPPPGPGACGEDPTADALPDCSTNC